MYGDLIYLSNQAKICALQECKFGRVLRSEMLWFDALKNTLICLQSVVEELLWGVLAWSNRALFFVDFKCRWRRLENSLRERASLLEELILKKICISKNSNPLPLGWGPLFIEICRGSQVFSNATWRNFIGWSLLTGSCIYVRLYWRNLAFMSVFIDEILPLWRNILNISFQMSTFHWPRNIWRLICFSCHLFQFYFILYFKE